MDLMVFEYREYRNWITCKRKTGFKFGLIHS